MFFSEGQEYVEENYNDWSKLYTTLQLFEKNNAQGAFSCIISLHTKLYEREWPCTSDLLYNENNLIGRLYHYFLFILKPFLLQRWKPCFCWCYLSLLWNRQVPSVHYTDIFYQGLQKILECILLCVFLCKS